jgi:protein required for attachment to host cells
MTNDNTWILVCDASRARLFREKPQGKGLEQVTELEHGESRLHVRDLMSDANGRKPVGPVPARSATGQGGAYGRPGAAPDTDPKEVEAQKFARELADMLEKGLNDHAYEHLVVVAPPHFLGTIRGTVSAQVKKHLETTIDKDLTNLDLPELTRRLESSLPSN